MNRLPFFVARDVDGFFGLFVDNLVQLLLIVSLTGLCGISAGDPETGPLLLQCILPGAALSILAGNLSYAWQARRIAQQTGRDDVTALPYGINTPSLLVYIFFVMKPVYDGSAEQLGSAAAARLAWQFGLLACLGSGVIELAGAFVAERIRRCTPRAALLSTLAGIAVGFISMTFALQIFQRPMVAMLPLGIVLLTYFARVRFPLGLPGGLLAVIVGTVCAWLLPLVLPESISGPAMSTTAVRESAALAGFTMPKFAGAELWELVRQPDRWLGFLSVIIPMGLFNVIGSLQNIESAEAAGDRFATAPSLAVNGIGTILAALFGSCFPTTIYIGHPGWKALGARSGYAVLNGAAITAICLTGTVAVISSVVPLEAGVAIVLWIGIIMVAQAFQATPPGHAPAVATGFFPAIAAWGATIVPGAFAQSGGRTMQELLEMPPIPVVQGLTAEVNGFLIHGMLVLERGYIFTCMILAAVCVELIERRLIRAAAWCLAAAVLTACGMMHAYQLSGNTVDYVIPGLGARAGAFSFTARGLAIGWFLLAILFALADRAASDDSDHSDESPFESESTSARGLNRPDSGR